MPENQAESAQEPWCPRPGQTCASPLCALTSEVTACVTAVRDYADAVSIANGGTTLTEFLLDQDLSNPPASELEFAADDPTPTRPELGEADA